MKEYDGRYSLLHEDNSINEMCAAAIDKLIIAFIVELSKIEDEFNTGVGDTVTNDKIVDALYSAIHYRNLF